MRGDVIYEGDKGYEKSRAIWNGMIDKSPTAIARCTGTADVVAAVDFAREHDLLLSVRGAGHNVAGHALCDGGLMIDLSQMKGIHVDPHAQTARVQPGVDLGDLDRETQLFGLATPTGIVSKTGLAGLTLGGGFGWLARKHGFTADNLLSADVVTAEGRILRASKEENPDLFWGIRGGGGNFGVVTSFEYQLHPVGPTVLGGLLLHPMETAAELLRFYRDFVADAPEELGSLFAMRLAPPAPFLPEEIHGKPVCGLIVLYAGDLEEGERVLKPLREFGQPLADKIGPKPYVAVQSMLDEGQTEGHRYYWKSHYLTELPDEAVESIVARGATIPTPLTRVLMMQLGGAVRRREEMDMAASHRDAEFVLAINNGWRDPEEDDKQIGWVRDFWSAMRPFSSGTYVNFIPAGEGQEGVWAAYGEEKYRRLVEVKNKYDPANLFRINQNIEPTV
jgi:FAD/FMN-containing dehydrogenase